MFQVVVFINKYGKKSARLIVELGYKTLVLSWDTNLCAEILKISVFELLSKENGSYIVK